MKKTRYIFICFGMLLLTFTAFGWKEVDDIVRRDADNPKGFEQRVTNMWGERIPGYKIHPQDPTEDSGKRYWSRLLSQLKFADKYNLPFDSLIRVGRSLVESQHPGSFRKPFSCAGFAMYYFNWKDSIAKYDPEQIDLIRQRVDSTWRYLLRTDHLLDACCGYNLRGGKEFNSENFQWMLKSAGYLFAHDLDGKSVNGRIIDMHSKDVDSIEVRLPFPNDFTGRVNVKGMDVTDNFDNSLINLTKTLFSAGRVEWNSNNYFGHTLNPLHTIYQCAGKSGDPNWRENEKRAQACLDWMLAEAAIHYRDGFQVAADARAKSSSFLPFKGSYFQYTIPYFAGAEDYPSFGDSVWKSQNPGDAEIGFLVNSDYRVPQVLADIANKQFQTPVEIQSAKPFYHIDMAEFVTPEGTLTGKSAYSNYANPDYGRRFEFETLYIGDHFTMSSVAGGRPDGREGTFSEQCLWKIGTDGSDNGCVIMSGNAGSMTTSAGRYPWHQIGQYRNMMMQLVKSPENNRIWIAVPNKYLETTPLDKKLKKDIYLDAGNGTYIAIHALDKAAISIDESYKESPQHTCLQFVWPENMTGAILIEVEDGNPDYPFDKFKKDSAKRKISVKGDKIGFINSSGNKLEMKFKNPEPYRMTDRTFDTPFENPLPEGGSYPEVWHDGNKVDFMSWDSYRTVYGFPIINQQWGSGVLELRSKNEAARISVDKSSGKVRYYTY